MMIFNLVGLIFFAGCLYIGADSSSDSKCNVRARIESGWVCGLIREAELGVKYASFRGVPYGEQPLGELRFKELQPVKPWSEDLDATKVGPICPQDDRLYGNLVDPISGMNESCIYANIHVPFNALPVVDSADDESKKPSGQNSTKGGYPIFVFIHGGGFTAGSGAPDLQGPEYLVSKGFIAITFNYRLNVFGFLSLNSAKIPGNAGLRDQLTLLRWVQKNARAFGGDPDNVTLAGQSAGGASVHLLALSRAARGLFKRIILMSGTAITSFYTASPAAAKKVATTFLNILGINSTDPDSIHDQLVNMPIERIMKANSDLQKKTGLSSFMPVVEDKYPGVTRIIDDDPMKLIKRGRDKQYPIIVGFANNECAFFRHLLEKLKTFCRIKKNPSTILAAGIPFSTAKNVSLDLANKVIDRYFPEDFNYDDYMVTCRDTLFKYPAFQLVRARAKMNAAPSYLYQFAYDSDFSVLKAGLNISYEGAAHVEDLTYIFRENVILDEGHKSFPPEDRDDVMKDWMTTIVVNFMKCDDPSCGKGWSPVDGERLNYKFVNESGSYSDTSPTSDDWDMIHFHDEINEIGRGDTNI